MVYTDSARATPAGGAYVFILGRGVIAGNPSEPVTPTSGERANFDPVSVYHDFGDGKGPVLAERRVAGLEGNVVTSYVYLRKGEYLLGGLRPRDYQVSSQLDNHETSVRLEASQATSVAVRAGEVSRVDIVLDRQTVPR
jgi:hypothetical protein